MTTQGAVEEETRSLPFGEISWPASGNKSIAEVIGSSLQRRLWPRFSHGANPRKCLQQNKERTAMVIAVYP